jgi:hypothetical protein
MTRSRSAKTLVEMMAIISVLSVVLGASTTTLATLMRLERQFRKDTEQVTSLTRLAAHLRSDAHQAQSCQVRAACVLALPDGREVLYAVIDREITREVRRGVEIEHRDGFVLPLGAAANFTSVDQPDGTLVRLSIRPAGEPVSGWPPVLATTIDAAVGLPRKEARQ